MLISRLPSPALAPFVARLWYHDDTGNGAPRAPRERALPTGTMDLVLRLSDEPIRVFADLQDPVGCTFGHAAVVGVRRSFYVRDTRRAACSVGVHFRPGGAAAFFGMPATELAGRHATLEDLWGSAARGVLERLREGDSDAPQARLTVLEALMLERRPQPVAQHPAVVHALGRLGVDPAHSVRQLCVETQLSHRRLIELFTRAVGLPPKLYGRIRRFQRLVELAARGRSQGWAALALACGFCDQSHAIREFQAFAGIAPGAYQPAGERTHHVPVHEPAGSRTSKPDPGRRQ